MTRGYHGRPALTAERFVPDHLSDLLGKLDQASDKPDPDKDESRR